MKSSPGIGHSAWTRLRCVVALSSHLAMGRKCAFMRAMVVIFHLKIAHVCDGQFGCCCNLRLDENAVRSEENSKALLPIGTYCLAHFFAHGTHQCALQLLPFFFSLPYLSVCSRKCGAITTEVQEWKHTHSTLELSGPGIGSLGTALRNNSQPRFVRTLWQELRGLHHLRLDGLLSREFGANGGQGSRERSRGQTTSGGTKGGTNFYSLECRSFGIEGQPFAADKYKLPPCTLNT